MPHHENLIPNAFTARRREAVRKGASSWGLDLEMDSASRRGLVWQKEPDRTHLLEGESPQSTPKGRGWSKNLEGGTDRRGRGLQLGARTQLVGTELGQIRGKGGKKSGQGSILGGRTEPRGRDRSQGRGQKSGGGDNSGAENVQRGGDAAQGVGTELKGRDRSQAGEGVLWVAAGHRWGVWLSGMELRGEGSQG